jgi:hypothetical protein
MAPAESSTRARFRREHPRLYASRHVLKGAAQVAVVIIGVTFALRLLPAIPWPDIDPPDLPLPHLEIGVPEWIKAIARSKKFWLPIVIGIFLALGELERRKRRNVERDDRAGDAARPGEGTPE